jgi:pyruvate dehydrogenase E2 component (dihydrolipoamide acetyltransferase)
MSESRTFHLPDLGEGLPDAEIVTWHVKVGDPVRLDAPLVSMETAKAVVDVPSPYSGTVVKLHGAVGDVIDTGAPLVEIAVDPNLPQRAEAHDTGHSHAPARARTAAADTPPVGAQAPAASADGAGAAPTSSAAPIAAAPTTTATGPASARSDSGTVVGAMESSDRVVSEMISAAGGVRAMPAVRALARKLGVDLARVRPTGADGVVTLADVKGAAAVGTAKPLPAADRSPDAAAAVAAGVETPARTPPATVIGQPAQSLSGRPIRTVPPSVSASGQPELLKGVRRNMARVMADAHAQVVPTTLTDDADLHAWDPGEDVTVRLVRAIVAASRAVPDLNAWFDGRELTRTVHRRVDIGLAVDTEDGLFVPALRNADVLDAAGIRAAVERLRAEVLGRSIAPDELRGYTIMLSNFGMYAGRYATPVLVPPCVAIIAAGRARHAVVPVMGGIETHRVLPLSLTFDHRAVTGSEAARFLKALLEDLARAG